MAYFPEQPEDIIALIEKYPDFKPMYAQVYEICQNIEQVMGMFSKELYELDRNTVRYMIDELQEETEPLPAKAGRFGVLLKQPKVVSALCYSFYL